MKCPKCKKEIEENSLKCSFCNTKIGLLCSCGTYNLITAEKCSKCNKVLLKICTECGSANFPNAIACRKCGIEFVSTEILEKKDFSTQNTSSNTQQMIKSKLLESVKNFDSRIITISGPSGIGKNLVLRSAINDLKNANLIWLMGTCTQTSQLSPFGYFQDLLLTFFNINNFCPDTLQLKKNSIKFFKQDFPSLSNNEIIDLLNLLYPDTLDIYENIYFNKTRTFTMMKKVITTILAKTKAVFVIDNFEYIDGMSYDFLKELLNEQEIINNAKFIIISSITKPGLGLITSPLLNENNYLDLSIASFTTVQIESMLKQYKDFTFGKDFVNLAMKLSNGNPAIIEQMVLLNNDIKRNKLKNINYENLITILKYRLEILKSKDIKTYRMLLAMSVLGTKFYPAILESFDNNSYNEFEGILEKLVNLGFITQINNLAFEFKSNEIWKNIVSIAKNDEHFEEILNILYEIINAYKQSSIALLGYIVQKLNNNDKAFENWTLLMKQANYIGDIGLYIIVQKQALKLIENKANDFYINVKKNIYTRVGKLLSVIDYSTAIEYLQNALSLIDDTNDLEHIELLGYLADCSIKMGNYCGALECINNVLNRIPDDKQTEKMLVKTRQIKPLLELGNYGQLINIVETEIFNHLENLLTKGKYLKFFNIDKIFKVWLNTFYDFTEALIFQGDNRGFEKIQIIYDVLDKNKVTEPKFLCRVNLLLALANTIRGDIKTSNQILDDVLKEYTLDNMDSRIISRWNFIDILNKFFLKDYNILHSELFNIVAYANNINDNFTKNILKTLLAKILKENNQTKKALEILEEQVAYFAQEKVATGVLLSWYLIAEIKLITTGTQFALDIATKALDIAQTPNINNYYFIALFNKLIGEIYLAKQDFESAKVYFEKAIFLAKQFNLQFILVKTYLQSAKLFQELALPKSSKRGDYIKSALKMFQNAKNVPIVAEQQALQKQIKEDLNILTSFCKLNGIILKKEIK